MLALGLFFWLSLLILGSGSLALRVFAFVVMSLLLALA
jgi:hypothetical protein